MISVILVVLTFATLDVWSLRSKPLVSTATPPTTTARAKVIAKIAWNKRTRPTQLIRDAVDGGRCRRPFESNCGNGTRRNRGRGSKKEAFRWWSHAACCWFHFTHGISLWPLWDRWRNWVCYYPRPGAHRGGHFASGQRRKQYDASSHVHQHASRPLLSSRCLYRVRLLTVMQRASRAAVVKSPVLYASRFSGWEVSI